MVCNDLQFYKQNSVIPSLSLSRSYTYSVAVWHCVILLMSDPLGACCKCYACDKNLGISIRPPARSLQLSCSSTNCLPRATLLTLLTCLSLSLSHSFLLPILTRNKLAQAASLCSSLDRHINMQNLQRVPLCRSIARSTVVRCDATRCDSMRCA